MELVDLKQLLSHGAALRSRTVMQPAGDVGDKVFPPTYVNAQYAKEKRKVTRDDGTVESVECVLLDSVQSQANRMEEALQEAVDAKTLNVPLVEVDFTEIELVEPIGKVTSLQAPHRIADAILRDSELGGVAFRKSDVGKQLDNISNRNATPLFELCPTALIFGVWDSTGPKGGLGAKFARAMVSEIIGFNAEFGVKTGSRIDPLQIRAGAKVVIGKDGYKLAKEKEKKAVSPSEVNHGNIPPDIDDNAGGVTISHAEQTLVISMPAFRRLRFPVNGKYESQYDEAARTVLVSLSLVAATLAAETGFDLRSRCLLWPTEKMKWELLSKPGESPDIVEIGFKEASRLYGDAVEAAKAVGLPYRTEPVTLKPGKSLTELLQRSQEIAAETGIEEDV